MNEQYYKPSGRFSWKGIILMFLTYLVVGTALSWVYLWINRVSPSIYLCLFAAIGFGTAVGVIARLCVKLLKVRNVKAVLIGAVAGLVCMNYVKWAMYDYYDYKQIAEDYEEYISENAYISNTINEMKSEKAYAYYEMNYDFDETSYTFDENYDYLVTTIAYDYLASYDKNYGTNYIGEYTSSEIEELKSMTVYELFNYDVLLGTSKEECKKNLEKAKSMSAYEFYYEYREIEEGYSVEIPSMFEILTDPGMLWEDIKQINKEGRWSISSSSSSSSSYSSPSSSSSVVKGGMLWFIWIGELVIITLIAFFIPYGQSKKVFIEMDNNWAKSTDGNRFTFSPLSKSQVKAMLEQSPDNIVNMMMIRPSDIPVGRPYMKMTLDHSEDYTEAYLNVLSMTYNAKNRNYVSSNILTGLRLRPKHTGMLFTMFGMPVPSRVAADGEFYEWDRARNERMQSMTAQQVAPQPSSYVAPNRDVEYDEAAYEAWRAGRLNDQNNNDIDSDIL